MPKNESLVGNGSLAVRHTLVQSPQHKIVSKVSQSKFDSKRNSAVSNTSTNGSGTARKRKTHIGPWQLGSTVGKGGTARVRKVRHVNTGQTGVAKIVARPVAEKSRALSLMNLVNSQDGSFGGDKNMPLGLEREIAIMKLLDHRNIVRLYDVWENRNEIYLIMELVEGGELFDYVARRQRLGEDIAVFLFRQIVCALLYCHRLHIHHRDLKPENILLDHDAMCVKLVDFGMAALQPAGNLLTTPCGSPHYAAPELLSSKAYDGGQADVWSCGVVLFVMLTGYPPFNFPSDPHNQMTEDKKLKALFRAIHNADYRLPSALGSEAKDLLAKIFIPDPHKRIKIDEIWQHPFLHKYDAMYDIPPMRRLESLIGPQPTIKGWVPLTAKRISPDIFRALRTLWHSETAEALIRKLCNDEPNQEKYFYNAMLKYQAENLQDFQKDTADVGYSASDYQHSRPTLEHEPMPSEVDSRSTRSKSTFSICGSEHLQSRHSFYEIPVSEASYDPFRASRDPVTKGKGDLANVTVRRVQSSSSRRTSLGNHGSSLRVEVLRRDSRRSTKRISNFSSTSVSLRGSPASRGQVRGKRSSRSVSRLSVGSSALVSSSPITAIRRSDIRKRSVQFSHLRKSSTASALTSCADSSLSFSTPSKTPTQTTKLGHSTRNSFPFATGQALHQHSMVRSRKENAGGIMPTPRTRKARDIDQEARKVSSELEKACEEAFFRSSIGSSGRGSMTEKRVIHSETPRSSLSQRSPYDLQKDAFFSRIAEKPLPPTPSMDTKTSLQTAETPGTYTAREMKDLRERLAARYEMEGTANDQQFSEVLNTLDVLMSPIAARMSGESQRAVSAPQPHHDYPEDSNFLSVIPEEGRYADNDDPLSKQGKSTRWPHRAFTEPLGRSRHPIDRHEYPETTIRLVQPSSPVQPTPPQPWAPLNIRKQSSTISRSSSRGEDQSDEILGTPQALVRQLSTGRFEHLNDRKGTRDVRFGSTSPKKPQGEKTRFFGMFKKKKMNLIAEEEGASEDAPMAEKEFFKATPNVGDKILGMQNDALMKSTSSDNVSKLFGYLQKIAQPFFDQFASFKPASAVIPLAVSRGTACNAIVREVQLQAPGLEISAKQPNRFTLACKVNAKYIKGVKKNCSFDLEIFAVDKHNRAVDYSVVRITLTRGSSVTLRQVAMEIDSRLSACNLVVKSKKIADELCDTLGQGLRRSDWIYMPDGEVNHEDKQIRVNSDRALKYAREMDKINPVCAAGDSRNVHF
ncbi:hypothetical protein FKW77_010475 [Venturia effusa]|uniref:non-specific serine/threonine protein kinase n=1 Tax=Venturia effusa TaxID=50376 RepID=A0A517L4J9_9PEZI|nr:hypothetical protein FKW77_010475 [Venturia effusa]